MEDVPLHGEFDLRLDDKGRLTLPREARSQMAESNSTALIARAGTGLLEPSVWLVPESLFETHSAGDGDTEDMPGFDLRMFDLAVTSRLACDKRGRVTLPERLLSYYGIHAPEVTLLGIRDHFELWSRSGWQEHRARRSAAKR
jgi:DNA-binding transcriptional regulator/RsmH inhibitor MraZ